VNVLIVYAHPEPRSFNHAMKEAAVQTLTGAGHTVTVSDLYAMGFDPVARPEQFVQRADPAHFKLLAEQKHAAEMGHVPADVAPELEKLLRADFVIFQFPLWWGSMPAILKGYVDRVFMVGAVYGRGVSSMHGKKALAAVTRSGSPAAREEDTAALVEETRHIHQNVFGMPGFDVQPPFVVPGPGAMSPEEREAILAEYRERLLSIANG
jgi:NAD(P)H dehydrogenase (quinone)